MKEDSVFDLIIDIITSYRELPQDFSDINELLYYRKQLSTYNATLTTEIGSARRLWRRADSKLEIEKNQKRVNRMGDGTTKADWISRANTEEELKSLVELEGDFYQLDYLFKGVKEVLSEMNQRISYLKSEQNQNRMES